MNATFFHLNSVNPFSKESGIKRQKAVVGTSKRGEEITDRTIIENIKYEFRDADKTSDIDALLMGVGGIFCMPKVYRILLGKHYDPVDCGSKGVLDLFILPLISRKLITEFRAFRDDYFNNKDRRHHWSDEPLLCALYLGFAMGVGIELVRCVVAVILTIAFAGADLLMGVVTPLVMAAYLPVSLGIKLYEEYTEFCKIDPKVESVEENDGLTPSIP